MEVKPGYKQTEVGVIPEEWDAGGLSRFWSVTDCKHMTAEFIRNGFPVASIREVQSRFIDLTNAKQTTKHFYNLLIEGGRKPQPGDLILAATQRLARLLRSRSGIRLLRWAKTFVCCERNHRIFPQSSFKQFFGRLLLGTSFPTSWLVRHSSGLTSNRFEIFPCRCRGRPNNVQLAGC